MSIGEWSGSAKANAGASNPERTDPAAGSTVLLAGGDALLREGVKRLLAASLVPVVGELEQWTAPASPPANAGAPGILLAIDPELRIGTPPPWLPLVNRLGPETRVVALFSRGGDREAVAALQAGAAGCLFTAMSATALVLSLQLVALGENVFPCRISSAFAHLANNGDPFHLTPRERDILRGLVSGRSNKEIANGVGTTDMTVKAQLRHLLRKLGVTNRTQAALWAREHGFD
ncbi:MAG: response regulator transcription factor [Alphaproteobacteria bacterium]|nr:response regulator transcription factor [Alphaproteobacteria bacterium]MCB9930942.1 response regulator transcription factor [Alphaproteobacteria bacterium]